MSPSSGHGVGHARAWPNFARHNFSLDTAALDLGMRNVAPSGTFFDKLARGEPVVVAILGASVAENAGCLTQPHKRCMTRNGAQPTVMSWGYPRTRPHKGFLVRFFEWINATWPHPQHQLHNAGRDASTLSTIAPCLFSHLPAQMDLLLLESGSMISQKASLIETIVRQLLQMRPPISVLILNVHLWCTFGGSISKKTLSAGVSSLPNRLYTFWAERAPHYTTAPVRMGANYTKADNPSDAHEDALNHICARYNAHVSCVSQRDALTPGFREGRDGHSISEIAGDCLHPSHGSMGTE